jgi:hypothetical protein
VGDIVIRCNCGKLICGDTLCPDCGRVYRQCDLCDEYYCTDELIDGVCTECLSMEAASVLS